MKFEVLIVILFTHLLSNDYVLLTEKLGVGIYDDKFSELVRTYAKDHYKTVYAELEKLRSAIESHRFIRAGVIYGGFLRAVISELRL